MPLPIQFLMQVRSGKIRCLPHRSRSQPHHSHGASQLLAKMGVTPTARTVAIERIEVFMVGKK